MRINWALIILTCLCFGSMSQNEVNHKDGKEIKYYNNGKIESILHYKSNKLDSTCVWYYDNGKISSRINFKNGLKNGAAHYYNKEGVLELINYMKNDTSQLYLQFSSNGELFKETYNCEQIFYIKGVPYTNQEYINKKTKIK